MDTHKFCLYGLGLIAMAGGLASCSFSAPPEHVAPSAVASPAMTSVAQAADIAKITEIQRSPVFVRPPQAAQELAAKAGMGIKTGETIRTQGQALAQVDLNNGLAFRIGGDAVLTLQPDNRLQLASGNMITWIQPGQKVPTEIVTPAGVAGIRGTTVYVEIPKDPQQGILFFAWEGVVSVRLPGQTEEVTLKTADEVRIKPNERDISLIRQRVHRMPQAEWRQRRQGDRLLHSFRTPLPTLPIINKIKPGQVSLQDPVAAPKQETQEQTGS